MKIYVGIIYNLLYWRIPCLVLFPPLCSAAFYTDFFNGVTAPPPPPLCASSATKGEKKMKAGKKQEQTFGQEPAAEKN